MLASTAREQASKFGEEAPFVGQPRAQATSADFGWTELVPVTDLASAQRAIDTILEQGSSDWEQDGGCHQSAIMAP